jgi:hypothetical protein
MLLVSGSALDRTCPGARRSLVPPEDGTSDHAAGVLAAVWTGLTWQATTSLRTRSPPWRYVTVSPPVRLGAVIRSSFVRSQWLRLDRQRQRCPGTSTQVTAAASHVSPLYQAFRRMPRRSIVETLLRTLVADISPSRRSCDRVFGFLSTHRCRPEVQATRHSAIGSPACRQPRVDSSARRIEAGSGHPPGFIAQDRRSGSSVLTSCRWSRVPNPAPGLPCPR